MAVTIYASREVFKDELDIDPNNTTLDTKIDRALSGASRGIDRVTGRRFWVDDNVSQRDLSLGNRITQTPTGEQLLLLNGWDISTAAGLIVATGSVGGPFTTLAASAYVLYPDDALVDGWPIEGLVQPTGIWVSLPGFRVRITAKWGWPSIPDDIQQACLILARRLYNRKDSPSGVMGSAEWVVNLAKRDPDVVTLLEKFCLPGFG